MAYNSETQNINVFFSYTNETRSNPSDLSPALSGSLGQSSISTTDSNLLSIQPFNPKIYSVLSSKTLLSNMRNKSFAKDKLHFNSNKLVNQNLQSMFFRNMHTSVTCFDVMDFFDKEEYWGQPRVRVGRSWFKEELRLKSNEDLHKLW